MRFWITKNSEVPVKEQLVRQVMLGILSEDLPAGHRLPSIRLLARRHRIHSNTVSAAYHDLTQQGWLEFRRGSGLYVRGLSGPGEEQNGLDHLLADALQAAKAKGYEPEDVLQRLTLLIRPQAYKQVLIVEPEPAMRAILENELLAHIPLPIETASHVDSWNPSELMDTLVVALPTRAARVRRALPKGVLCVKLRLSSVQGSLDGQVAPGPQVVSIVSGAPEIRLAARAMLIAVGLDPDSLCDIDATLDGWRERLPQNALVVTDKVTADQLPVGCRARVFHLIADSSIAELKQICGL